MSEILTAQDALIARLEDENAQLRRELVKKDQVLESDRRTIAAGVANLRRQLSPLYTALKQVFGEMEGLVEDTDPTGGSSHGPDSRVSAVWDSWKGRLSPACGRVIDALLIHGALNSQQICVAAKMGMSTLLGGTGVIAKLNKAGLLDKNGGKFSLKKL